MSLVNLLSDILTGKLSARVLIKRSNIPGSIPTSEQLVPGELAVNLADKTLYTVDNEGDVFLLGSSDTTITTKKITDPGEIL